MPSQSSPISDRPSPPEISTTIPPIDRSERRDVYIYDPSKPKPIGGLILTNGVTNANFYSMVGILVLFESNFELRDEDDTKIERNNSLLQPGEYYINAAE
jgi:hypothetical protein